MNIKKAILKLIDSGHVHADVIHDKKLIAVKIPYYGLLRYSSIDDITKHVNVSLHRNGYSPFEIIRITGFSDT